MSIPAEVRSAIKYQDYETLNQLIGDACAERGWCPFCIADASECGFDSGNCSSRKPPASEGRAIALLWSSL